MADVFEGWAILELMGHRRLAGYVQEATIAGSSFVRIDVPDSGEPDQERAGEHPLVDDVVATQFYAPSAVYCITPTTEITARALALRARPAPVQRWELEPPRVLAGVDEALDDDEDDLRAGDSDGF